MAGVPNVLFESAIHPRAHVGESLVTSTTRVFKDIGFLETMEREGFVRKYGASWHPIKTSHEFSILFKEYPQEGVDQDYTYHVDRSRFDALLLKHASELGTEVYQGAAVTDIVTRGGRVTGVRVAVAGQTLDVEADVVIDASGRRALIGRKLGLLEKDPYFDQYATHAWFKGVSRSVCGTERDIHIYFLPVARGWVWQIPITEEITSVGVVVEKRELCKVKGDVEAWFHEMLRSTPDVSRAMAGAERVNEFKREGDYSYSMDRFAGPGFVLVGDAARFVDPIFSSGVSVALSSAKFAAASVAQALAGEAPEEEVFAAYDRKLRAGCDIWYEFISLYYRLLPLFTIFIRQKGYRLQVLELLQGEVYDRSSVPVLDAMREFIAGVEKNEKHVMHRYLGNLEPHLLQELPG
jgi:1H-pyrrole-2-carbonyl-[peptidyl-carrier protein] chlorinase